MSRIIKTSVIHKTFSGQQPDGQGDIRRIQDVL